MQRLNTKYPLRSCSLAVALMACAAAPSDAAVPAVSGALVKGERVHGYPVMKISGSGFSQKPTAAPIIIDSVDKTVEWGVEKTYFSDLADGYPVQESGENNSSPWADLVYQNQDEVVTLDTPAFKRYPNAKRAYRLKGSDAWFGKPVAYGGSDGWEKLPTDEPQLYISYWFHTNYNPTNYWRFGLASSEGAFKPGERVRVFAPNSASLSLNVGSLVSLTVGDFVPGTFIGYDETGWANVELDYWVSAPNLKGGRMVGETSKASAPIPTYTDDSKSIGYHLPGTKIMRVWDEPTGFSGIRSSVAVHDFYVGAADKSKASGLVYDKVNLSSDRWHRIEYEIDMERGFARAYIDGRLRGQANFSPDAGHSGQYSPTIALMGVNGKETPLLNSFIDDIYIDNSFNRVIVGNAPSIRDVTVAEVQAIRAWDENSIEIVYDLKGLDEEASKYIYVYNRQGEVNQEGYPVCGDGRCGSPPEPVKLFVK